MLLYLREMLGEKYLNVSYVRKIYLKDTKDAFFVARDRRQVGAKK